MPRRWHAYKSLEWFILVGFAMAAFFALVAAVMVMMRGRPARVVVWQPATPQTVSSPEPIPSPDPASEGWQTYRDEKLGVEFLYPPEGFGARFISIHSAWPPAVIITPSGSRLLCEVSEYPGRDGHTQREAVVNNHRYCVRNSGDAAAGSAYHDLQYTTVKEGRAVTLAFTLRYTNCGAYDPPEMQACEVERRPFSPDPVVDKIFSTLRFIEPNTTNWQTYRNEELGFTLQYPEGWQLTPGGGINFSPSVITVNLPNTSPDASSGVSVYYYPSVADETENKSSHLGATTLQELIDRNILIQKIGDITINGTEAVEVIRGGNGAYYTVFIERDGHLYEIFFAGAWNKEDLTEVERQILSTFRFIK